MQYRNFRKTFAVSHPTATFKKTFAKVCPGPIEKELHFLKMSRVWDAMIELGADPDEKFGGESANEVALAMNSPVLK